MCTTKICACVQPHASALPRVPLDAPALILHPTPALVPLPFVVSDSTEARPGRPSASTSAGGGAQGPDTCTHQRGDSSGEGHRQYGLKPRGVHVCVPWSCRRITGRLKP